MSTTDTSKMTGKRVAEYRKSRRKSQQQLALEIGVSRSYIGDIEAGRCEPSRNFIQALLDVTDVNPDWLLTGNGLMRRSGTCDSPCDYESVLNRTKAEQSIEESNSCYESHVEGAGRGKSAIRIAPIATDFLAELARLTPEQQAQALEFIREKRRLNELEAKVSALAARR